MRLTDEELRDVLTRAEEIQAGARTGPAAQKELEAVINAAAEIGIERSAIERAMRERLALLMSPPKPGSLVFARSSNDKFYVAEVLDVANDNVRVRFLRGTEHDVTFDQLRPASFNPGDQITAHWPWWGPWTCTVISYDSANQTLTMSDGWGSTETFPIGEVWVAPKKVDSPISGRTRIYVTLLGAGAAIGAVVGSLITALLTR